MGATCGGFLNQRGEACFQQATAAQNTQIQYQHIDQLKDYARNPRKNDAAVDRMCGSIREYGFKIPVLVRSTARLSTGTSD